MHIAYLASLYPYASDTYVRNEVNALRAAGWRITPFAVRRPELALLVDESIRAEANQTEYLLDGGYRRMAVAVAWAVLSRPVRLLKTIGITWTTHCGGLRNRVKQLAYVCEAALLARLMLRQGVRHLHNHVAENSATVAMLASHLSGIPYSMTVHGPGIFFHPRQWGLGEKVRRSAFTVCITEFCRSQCMVFTSPEYWSRLQVVHCGLGGDFTAELPSMVPPAGGFVCVGRLCAEKGHTILLEAVHRLVQAGQSVNVVMIGDGPMRVELERRSAQWGLTSQVRFVGWQSSTQVREHIRQARCLVVASFAEGLPIVIMESLAMSRPVLTTWVAGIPELIENGVNGWLVPPSSVHALADAMSNVLRTPVEELTKMGLAGRAKVLRDHNAATEAAKLAQLFMQSTQ